MSLQYQEQLAPSAHAYDVQTFVDAWKAEPRSLELRPPYQRNIVWDNDQRSYLVDSILRGLPVPELYLQKSTSADGEQRIVVVDGQQRISACIDYVRGVFALDTKRVELDSAWKGKRFDELDGDLRARFRNFNFIGRQLPVSLDENALREIFQRLNRTVEALEPQELRHAAYTGEFIRVIEQASESAGLTEMGIFSPKDIQRRRHDAFVSEVFFAYVLETFPNKKEGLDEQYMAYERQGMPSAVREGLVGRFGEVHRFLVTHGSRIRRTRFRNKSDAYTLLLFLMRNAEAIPVDEVGQEAILRRLEEISNLVSKIKRLETQNESTEALRSETHFDPSIRYLRAVERAASDRQNRVRRDEALSEMLRPLLVEFEAHSVRGDDSWLNSQTDDQEAEADSTEEELMETRRVLADDDD